MGMCDAMCQCDDCNRHPISGHPMRATTVAEIYKDMEHWHKPTEDVVSSPRHYTRGIECWDYIASHHMNFNQGCMVKYATRYLLKDNPVQDLEKVIAFAKKEIELLKEREG